MKFAAFISLVLSLATLQMLYAAPSGSGSGKGKGKEIDMGEGRASEANHSSPYDMTLSQVQANHQAAMLAATNANIMFSAGLVSKAELDAKMQETKYWAAMVKSWGKNKH